MGWAGVGQGPVCLPRLSSAERTGDERGCIQRAARHAITVRASLPATAATAVAAQCKPSPSLLQGHIKEITWEFEQTGEHEGAIFPVLHDYANPADAPERLLPHGAAAPAAACDAAACSKLLVAEEGLRLTEAALLLVLLGVVLAWLGSHLVLRRRRQPHTPAVAADPAATPVLADFPRFPHPAGDLAFPACSNSSFVTKAEAFMRFAGIPYAKQTGEAAVASGAPLPRPPHRLAAHARPLVPSAPQASPTPQPPPSPSCRTCSAARKSLATLTSSSSTWSGGVGAAGNSQGEAHALSRSV